MVWYDANRIERTVTRQFVCAHLLPDEIARLDRPLAFGDGLTDGTYWEWIDQKAKKIFLILVDLHVPDQIFGVIDDSWDDEDLPVAREHVERLALTPSKDERFERKFYQRQFHYLLKPLERSDHVAVYEDMEVVPLDLVDRRPGVGGVGSPGSAPGADGSIVDGGELSTSASGGSSSGGSSGSSSSSGNGDRVVLPNYPGMVFSRRRIPLAPVAGSAYGNGYVTLEEFQYEVSSIKSIQNDHLVSYWTSYVHQGYGYVLFTPASDGSLKSLLATTPAPVKALSKRDRRRLVFNWIHCLVDTLCFVHNRGLHHGNIKPSTVLFRHTATDNHIFFSDFTQFGLDSLGYGGGGGGGGGSGGSSQDKASFDKESYDYAAPEQWYRPSGSVSGGSGGSGGVGSRKSTLNGEGGSGGRGAGITMYAGSVHSSGNSVRGVAGSSAPDRGGGGSESAIGSGSPDHMTSPTAVPAGYVFQMGASSSFSISRSSTMGGDSGYYTSGYGNVPIPQLDPQAADVFSLGCIILELLSFMLKKQTRSFATHRAARHKTPGRGGAVLDSSFHKNLGQVESLMAGLARDAASSLSKRRGKDDYDVTLAGVAPMLHVVERMLALHASERPSTYDVQTRMYQILREHCGILEPHCVHEYGGFNMGWNEYSPAAAVVGSMGSMGGMGGMGGMSGMASPSSSYGTGYGYAGYSGASSSYGHSPRLHTGGAAMLPLCTTASTATTSTTNSSRAVSPTMAMASGGYSWGGSGAVSPVAGPSRTGSISGLSGISGASSSRSAGTAQKTRRGATSASAAAAHHHGLHYGHAHRHSRTDSGSGGSSRNSTVGGSNVIPEEDTEGSTAGGDSGSAKGGGFDLTNGLQAIRNLQIRDKVRQSWNSPVYAA